MFYSLWKKYIKNKLYMLYFIFFYYSVSFFFIGVMGSQTLW